MNFNLFTADLSKSYVAEVARFFMMCNTFNLEKYVKSR